MKTRAVHFLIWEANDEGVKSHCLHRGDFSYFINVAIKDWLELHNAISRAATPPQPVPSPPPSATPFKDDEFRFKEDEGYVRDR